MVDSFNIQPSTRKNKKYMAIFPDGTITHFGQKGAFDYTIHGDKKKRNSYQLLHQDNENWKKTGIKTAGFLSRYILWNKPTLKEAIENTEMRFNIKISIQDIDV